MRSSSRAIRVPDETPCRCQASMPRDRRRWTRSAAVDPTVTDPRSTPFWSSR